MSREIKFRAFNKVTNKMVDLKKITPTALSAGFSQDGIFLPFNDDWPLMQFTGFKDKNGVEIYEGDLCQMSDWKPKAIVWSEGRFWLGNTRVTVCTMECALMEVVGNIYQNPALAFGNPAQMASVPTQDGTTQRVK